MVELVPIGISEEMYLALECDPPMLIFPRDYPDTVEGMRYWNDNTTSEWNDMRHYWEGGGGRIATIRKETPHQRRCTNNNNATTTTTTTTTITDLISIGLIYWMRTDGTSRNRNCTAVTLVLTRRINHRHPSKQRSTTQPATVCMEWWSFAVGSMLNHFKWRCWNIPVPIVFVLLLL
jgi:hypothetical protein